MGLILRPLHFCDARFSSVRHRNFASQKDGFALGTHEPFRDLPFDVDVGRHQAHLLAPGPLVLGFFKLFSLVYGGVGRSLAYSWGSGHMGQECYAALHQVVKGCLDPGVAVGTLSFQLVSHFLLVLKQD